MFFFFFWIFLPFAFAKRRLPNGVFGLRIFLLFFYGGPTTKDYKIESLEFA